MQHELSSSSTISTNLRKVYFSVSFLNIHRKKKKLPLFNHDWCSNIIRTSSVFEFSYKHKRKWKSIYMYSQSMNTICTGIVSTYLHCSDFLMMWPTFSHLNHKGIKTSTVSLATAVWTVFWLQCVRNIFTATILHLLFMVMDGWEVFE